jgi:hypothetical protein
MKTKKKTGQAVQKAMEDPKALRVEQQPTETSADAMAHASLRPTVQAALTLMDYNKAFGEMSINTLVADLGKQCELASGGDLRRTEALLVAQAHSLDAIFHKLARKATHSEYLNQLDVHLRLALKAQSQCRATLETLAEIKNPMSGAYVRQANIAAGHQQVNNGATPPATTRARETENLQSKLLETQDGERLDPSTQSTTGGLNSSLETVAAINRPKVSGISTHWTESAE